MLFSFSLPRKIGSFTDFESEVVVDLIALGKLFFHKPCQWLWNLCAIAAPQPTVATFCPHIPVSLNTFPCSPFTHLWDFPELSPILSPFLSRQGILLIANKGAVSLSPLVLLSEPSSVNILSILMVSTWTRHIIPAHKGTRDVKLAPQHYFILYSFPSSSEYLFYIFLNTTECWHFDNKIVISRPHSCVVTVQSSLVYMWSWLCFPQVHHLSAGMTCLHRTCADSSPMCHIFLPDHSYSTASDLFFAWISRSAMNSPSGKKLSQITYFLYVFAPSKLSYSLTIERQQPSALN